MRFTYFFGALVLLGAGCISVPVEDKGIEPAPTANIEAEESPSLLVPVDLNQGVEEMVVEEPTPFPVIKSFSLTARQWSFEPSTITVKKDDTVRLSIASVDVRHGFKLPTFGVDATLEPNQTTTVEFVADKAGTFSFFCNIFCGDGHGAMNGTLTVTE